MPSYKHASDMIHMYVGEFASRLVAKTGIPSDRHHIGKLMIQGLQDDPSFICQIDGATGGSETQASVLDRSIRCAISFSKLGLKKGDVVVLMGPNHLDFCIPHNAALFLGVMVACIDATLGPNELRHLFHTNGPKIIFCQNEKTPDVEKAIVLAEIKPKVITYDKSGYTTLAQLLENVDQQAIKNFKATDFEPEETVAYLTSTSGTTGTPKTAMLTHKNLAISIPYFWTYFKKFPTPTKTIIMTSPSQWLTAGFHYLYSSVVRYTRLQTSAPITPDHFAELVNKYSPTYIATSPTLLTTMIAKAACDLTCFEIVMLGGSGVSEELIDEVKRATKTELVYRLYGMSEISGPGTQHELQPTPGSCGRPVGSLEIRIINHLKNEDITEANVPGELWLRGPTVFKGYHNNPEATRGTLTADGWLKSGDIFYRDENWNLFYVDRLKSLLKYRNYQVAPVEIEDVIKMHPGVLHVAVTGIPDKECGDLIVACVVPRAGCKPTAQEIKDLVKESLADSKQLRGGVIFLDDIPITSTSKINGRKIKQLAATLPRE